MSKSCNRKGRNLGCFDFEGLRQPRRHLSQFPLLCICSFNRLSVHSYIPLSGSNFAALIFHESVFRQKIAFLFSQIMASHIILVYTYCICTT